MHWGPDLAFEGYVPESHGEYVLVAGRTGRDHATVVEAARSAGVSLRTPVDPPLPYQDFLPELRGAAVVVIPLVDPDGLFGLTELNDAFAFGKPVVMTRSPFVRDVGDVRGWQRVLVELMSDAALRRDGGGGSAGRRPRVERRAVRRGGGAGDATSGGDAAGLTRASRRGGYPSSRSSDRT